MSKPAPYAPGPVFNKLFSALAIGACAMSLHSLATDTKARDESPARTFGLLAAYGYMTYRNGRSLLNYHRATPNSTPLKGAELYRQQAQLDWDFGRTLLVVAADHLTAQPEAKLLRGAIDVAVGAYCIHSAYQNKKLAGPRITD